MNIFTFNKINLNLMQSKELNHNLVKFILSNKYSILKSKKIIKMAYKNLYFYKFSSISYFRKSCLISGNCRSVFKFFKLSRYICKQYASNGLFTGLRKASF
jgi:ribosomal protein S14